MAVRSDRQLQGLGIKGDGDIQPANPALEQILSVGPATHRSEIGVLAVSNPALRALKAPANQGCERHDSIVRGSGGLEFRVQQCLAGGHLREFSVVPASAQPKRVGNVDGNFAQNRFI